MEKKQVGELNEEREDWIERLMESWEEAPDLEITLNPLIIWAGAKIEEWTLEGILAFVNFVYDDAIESAQSEYVLPRLKVEKDTKAGYQFCVALPTSFSDEKEYYSEDEDENDQESKIDPDDSIEITQREEESDQYMDF